MTLPNRRALLTGGVAFLIGGLRPIHAAEMSITQFRAEMPDGQGVGTLTGVQVHHPSGFKVYCRGWDQPIPQVPKRYKPIERVVGLYESLGGNVEPAMKNRTEKLFLRGMNPSIDSKSIVWRGIGTDFLVAQFHRFPGDSWKVSPPVGLQEGNAFIIKMQEECTILDSDRSEDSVPKDRKSVLIWTDIAF